jgi:hypothetical protein
VLTAIEINCTEINKSNTAQGIISSPATVLINLTLFSNNYEVYLKRYYKRYQRYLMLETAAKFNLECALKCAV